MSSYEILIQILDFEVAFHFSEKCKISTPRHFFLSFYMFQNLFESKHIFSSDEPELEFSGLSLAEL